MTKVETINDTTQYIFNKLVLDNVMAKFIVNNVVDASHKL